MLSDVDKLQLRTIQERGPRFSMQTCLDMIRAVHAMYAVQLRKENPGLEGRALQLAVARRVYALDPVTLRAIDRVEAEDGRA